MTSIKLVLRPSSKGDCQGSLTLRIIHNRKIKNITMPDCRLYSYEWNHNSQTIIYPLNNPDRVTHLSGIELKIESEKALLSNYIAELEEQGYYNISDILNLYRKKSSLDKLLGYTALLVHELKQQGQERTARAYNTVARRLVTFNKGEDIPLHHINSRLIKSFENYLKDSGKLSNTISYYMRNLRAIYNKAVTSQHISGPTGENPFAGVYTGVTKTMKRALSLKELKELNALDFNKIIKEQVSDSQCCRRAEKLYRSWLFFFFCFYARGMCFIDLAYLRKENIRGGVLRYCRKKTGSAKISAQPSGDGEGTQLSIWLQEEKLKKYWRDKRARQGSFFYGCIFD